MSLLDIASLVITPNGYKEGKLYSVLPSDGSGDLSVTRATTATRVNEAGLVELVPYNLIKYSGDLSNAYWTKRGFSQISTTATAPDGSATAYKVQENNTNSNPGVVITDNDTPDGTATFSVWLKSDANTSLILSTNGGISGTSINITTSWQLFSVTQTNAPYNGPHIGGFASIAQNSGIVLYIWHPQLNEGSTAKDYQKTETRLNIPRLDYSNGSCPSILVEPQRTNLLNQSQNFSSSCWVSASGVTVTNNTRVAPDGTMTADTIAGTLAGNKVYYESSSFPTIPANSNTVTGSVYVYATSAITIILNIYEWAGSETSQSYTLTPNTWQRLVFTKTFSGGSGNVGLSIQTDAQTVFAWGAQLEEGSYATSYIPTTSASVTRNADVISKTGISSLIGQTEGTIFVDANISIRDTNRFLVDMQDGTNNDVFQFFLGGNTLTINIFDGGTLQATLNGGYCLGNKKIALGYKANDFVLYIDGVQVATDTSGSVPSASLIALGYLYIASGFELGDRINLTALWKTRLTNTQLAQLTTI